MEERLIDACIGGDRKAQKELYENSFAVLMSISLRYEKNREDAAALVNQCFLKVLRSLAAFRDGGNITSYIPWIKKIMTNTIIDEYRKNKNKQLDPIENENYLESLCQEDYNEIEAQIAQEELLHMLEQLSESQRQVFNLYAIDGYSHKEISEMLNIGISNSKWHLSQARKKLQELLKGFLTDKMKHHVK